MFNELPRNRIPHSRLALKPTNDCADGFAGEPGNLGEAIRVFRWDSHAARTMLDSDVQLISFRACPRAYLDVRDRHGGLRSSHTDHRLSVIRCAFHAGFAS